MEGERCPLDNNGLEVAACDKAKHFSLCQNSMSNFYNKNAAQTV